MVLVMLYGGGAAILALLVLQNTPDPLLVGEAMSPTDRSMGGG